MRKPTTDYQPGPPPDMRVAPEGIVFEFDETSGELGTRLVIRCDNNGNVFVRISGAASADDNSRSVRSGDRNGGMPDSGNRRS